MLVLSRKRGEEIVVPECQLVLRVLEIRGGKVRIGFSSPNGSKVYRREVWTRMQETPDVVESCTLVPAASAAG
jgi:carbon storage regulator CsrA